MQLYMYACSRGAKSTLLSCSYGTCFRWCFWGDRRPKSFPSLDIAQWECVLCSILEDECEKFCNVSILLLFFHWDNIPSIRPPPPHTMILWGAIRLELVRSVHMGVMVDNSKKNTACVATITENSTSIILCVLW